MKRRNFFFMTVAMGSAVVLQPRFFTQNMAMALPSKSIDANVTDQTTYAIGKEAYIYLLPQVTMEITRRISTSVTTPQPTGYAPLNQLGYQTALPDASFRDVVRANVDTLYGSAWFDLSQEPMVVEVPDIGDRFYVLQFLNMWTDVIADPGSRITEPGSHAYVLVSPDWQGELPEGTEKIASPTNIVWLIARLRVDSDQDVANVTALYEQFKLTPLSAYGQPYHPPEGMGADPDWDVTTPPLLQIRQMEAATFFPLAAELLANNPPYPADAPVVERMADIGLVVGQPFDWDALSSDQQQALTAAAAAGLAEVSNTPRAGEIINGWNMLTNREPGGPGRFGTNYIQRAVVALTGLGVNLTEDAVYPLTYEDGNGRPLNGTDRYRLRFPAGQLPPVRGFWSLTMYDQDAFFIDNPIDRYAIGDRSDLSANADGSLDIYIQHEPPADHQQSNWLPAPAGDFNMSMRLYWPDESVLNGDWVPPVVERLE
jgi:hypothetical protein